MTEVLRPVDIVQSPESEISGHVTFVFRGRNNYMLSLSNGLTNRGIEVDIRLIPNELWAARQRGFTLEEKESWKRITAGIGQSDSLVIVDNTVYEDSFPEHSASGEISSLTFKDRGLVVNAYDPRILFESRADAKDKSIARQLVQTLGPLIEEIALQNKKPAVLQRRLGDHYLPLDFSDPGKPELRAQKYASVIQEVFGLPIIEQPENLSPVLNAQNMKPEETVILVDHHVEENLSRMSREDLQSLGWYGVDLALACPCCAGKTYGSELENQGTARFVRQGFKLFSAGNSRLKDDKEITDDLRVRLLMEELRYRWGKVQSSYRSSSQIEESEAERQAEQAEPQN